ncbi:MAG: hypothetical protein QNJ94_10095 [Alphaproteobacteria bacterium]|nr:hypothetical protein [Alphaproteobacteria bacterium]
MWLDIEREEAENAAVRDAGALTPPAFEEEPLTRQAVDNLRSS